MKVLAFGVVPPKALRPRKAQKPRVSGDNKIEGRKTTPVSKTHQPTKSNKGVSIMTKSNAAALESAPVAEAAEAPVAPVVDVPPASDNRVVSVAELLNHGITINQEKKTWKGHAIDISKTAGGVAVGTALGVGLVALSKMAFNAIFGDDTPAA